MTPQPDLSADDGVTVALPICELHPPLSKWPRRNLATGVCPACGQHGAVPEAAVVRELRARHIIEERGL